MSRMYRQEFLYKPYVSGGHWAERHTAMKFISSHISASLNHLHNTGTGDTGHGIIDRIGYGVA
jgi:hypothetical protein